MIEMECISAEEDYKAVVAITRNQPFPSKEELLVKIQRRRDDYGLYMTAVLMGLPKPDFRFCSGAGLDLSCYDNGNYEDLKAIYDSGFDPKITRECGERIALRGENREPGNALSEMTGIANIMLYFSPLASSEDPKMRLFAHDLLKFLWHGICTPGGTWWHS